MVAYNSDMREAEVVSYANGWRGSWKGRKGGEGRGGWEGGWAPRKLSGCTMVGCARRSWASQHNRSCVTRSGGACSGDLLHRTACEEQLAFVASCCLPLSPRPSRGRPDALLPFLNHPRVFCVASHIIALFQFIFGSSSSWLLLQFVVSVHPERMTFPSPSLSPFRPARPAKCCRRSTCRRRCSRRRASCGRTGAARSAGGRGRRRALAPCCHAHGPRSIGRGGGRRARPPRHGCKGSANKRGDVR